MVISVLCCWTLLLAGHSMLKTELKQVSESSGLLYCDGKLWTFADAGNPAEIFSVDTTTGSIIQIVHIHNYPNTDWEDIAADRNYIYIGDVGNNTGNRTDLRILKIARKNITDAPSLSVNAEAIQFSYLDQKAFNADDQTNFDCEAIIAVRDSLYLFTKDRGDYQTRVYAVSKHPGNYQIAPISGFNTNGMVTGADYDSVLNKVVLIGYQDQHLNSFLYLLCGFQGNRFFDANHQRLAIGNNTSGWQTEGVTFGSSGGLLISCESTPEIPAGLYAFTTGQKSTSGNHTATAGNSDIRCYPNPANDRVIINSNGPMKSLEIYNSIGKLLYTTTIGCSHFTLMLNRFNPAPGIYFLKVRTQFSTGTLKLAVTNR